MNILVTGGAGFIGSHTVVALKQSGFNPIIIDNLNNSQVSAIHGVESILGQKVTFYEGDCNDKAFLAHIFDKEKIEGVIHFAAYKAVGESVAYPLKYYYNNLHSLVVLLELMQEKQVQNLVFSSSCTVYGQPDSLPVTEASPIKKAESPYGNTKQVCEEIIYDFIQSKVALKALALRYFNPIGAHPSAEIGELPLGVPNNLIPFITQTAAGIREKLSIFGNDYHTPDGTCIRDYIHVMDLADAHVKALVYLQNQSQNNLFDAINVGTGNGASVQEVVDTFIKTTGATLNYEIAPRRVGDVEQIYANAQKAKDLLAWQAKYSLAQALEDAWRWQQKLMVSEN